MLSNSDLVKDLESSSFEEVSQNLSELYVRIVNEPKIVERFGTRIVEKLKLVLTEAHMDSSLLATQILCELTNNNWKHVKSEMPSVFPTLIKNLGDNQPAIRKASHNTLLASLRAMSFSQFSQFSEALKRLGPATTEAIISDLYSKAQSNTTSVSTTPLSTTTKVQTQETASRETLKPKVQIPLNEIERRPSKSDKLFNVANVNRKKSADKLSKRDLIFGFIPPQVFDSLNETNPPKTRFEGLITFHKLIDERLTNKNEGIPLNDLFDKMLEFLNKIIFDSNSTIVTKTFEILNSLKVKILNSKNGNSICESILAQFRHPKFNVRQGASELLKEMMKLMNNQRISSLLTKSLININESNFFALEQIINLVESLSKEKSVCLAEFQFENCLSECHRIWNLNNEGREEISELKEKVECLMRALQSISDSNAFIILKGKYFNGNYSIVSHYNEQHEELMNKQNSINQVNAYTIENPEIYSGNEKFEQFSHKMLDSNSKSESKNASTNDTNSIFDSKLPPKQTSKIPKKKISNGLNIQGKSTLNSQKIRAGTVEEEGASRKVTLTSFEQRTSSTNKHKRISSREINEDSNSLEKIEERKEDSRNAAPRKSYNSQKLSNLDNERTSLEYTKPSYLANDDIRPLDKPETALKTLLNELKSDDWNRQFEALNITRSLAIFHRELLANSLSSLMPDILKCIDSLRSGLSKNALLTLADIGYSLTRQLDSHIELILTRLFKRGVEGTNFLAEEVQACLIVLCEQCSENKILNFLMSCNTKTSATKLALISCLETLAIRGNKDDRLIILLSNFMFEKEAKVRKNSRDVFKSMYENSMEKNELTRVLGRVLDDERFARIKLILAEKKEDSSLTSTKTLTRFEPRSSQNKRTLSKNVGKRTTVEGMDELSELLSSSPNDSKGKLDLVLRISEIIGRNPEAFVENKFSLQVIDVFSKSISDNNAKVAEAALNVVNGFLEPMKELFQKNLSSIANSLFPQLASSNAPVKYIADEVFNGIFDNYDFNFTLPVLVQGVTYAVAKAKPILLNKLAEILPDAIQFRRKLVEKLVVPIVIKLIDDVKAEKSQVSRLVKTLHAALGETLVSQIPKAKLPKFVEFLEIN